MKIVGTHKRIRIRPEGFVLAFALILMLILIMIGFTIIKIYEGAGLQAVLFQNEHIAMSNAEAAYENAIYWMSDNPDLLLDLDVSGTEDTISFPNSWADYKVEFYGFVGYRPVFEVTANGYCGTYHRGIRVHIAQAVSGWEMGACQVPMSAGSTTGVSFVDGEIVDMPIHINSYGAPDDSTRDIFISGSPLFMKSVSMGESRYSSGGSDKYNTVMDVFTDGISFDQPRSLITDENSIDKKIKWYKDTINDGLPELVFTPDKEGAVPEAQAAVQIEFFVGTDGKGYVRTTDDCTVRGYTTGSSTWDYKVKPGTDATEFEQYPIYGYHYIPENAVADGKCVTRTIESIQITSQYGVVESPPCGMIYVDGSVVIGSGSEHLSEPQITSLNVVQGKMVVVATGNIWVADSVVVSDKDDAGNLYLRGADGKPAMENPNALGLFAQGVVKVIDPGMVEDLGNPPGVSDMVYEPVAIKDGGYPDGTHHRHLPDPTILEAAMTVGGGGWGAEHVRRSFSGGRKETSGSQDDLVVRGTLNEVVRGVVGLTGSDGYLKNYYFDQRMLSGLIPGNVRLKGKFVTVPGGWSDFRVDTKPTE